MIHLTPTVFPSYFLKINIHQIITFLTLTDYTVVALTELKYLSALFKFAFVSLLNPISKSI